MLKRYELTINKGRRKPEEHKIMRAVQISSLVAMAEQMLEDDYSIKHIFIRDMNSTEMEIVK